MFVGAVARVGAGGEAVAGAFAHQVDDAAHFAAAVKEAAGAAHDFNAVKGGEVGQGAVDALHLRGQAIDVVFVVFVAARIDGGAAGGVLKCMLPQTNP